MALAPQPLIFRRSATQCPTVICGTTASSAHRLSSAPPIRRASCPFSPSASREPMTDHFFRVHDLVEPLLVDVPGLKRGLLQGQIPIIGLVGNGRRLVVTDNRA